MKTHLIVALVLFGLFNENYGENCEQNNLINSGNVPFPKTNNIMTMAVFDSKVVNKSLGEVEFALPIPPPFTLNDNFYCEIIKTNTNIYQCTCTGQTTQCNMFQVSLTPLTTGDALFTYVYNGNKIMEAYWSKNPDEYIWKIQCTSELSSSYACPFNNVRLGLYEVNKDQYNNAMKIRSMKDLNDTICVVYESNPEKLKWYTFTLTEPCEV